MAHIMKRTTLIKNNAIKLTVMNHSYHLLHVTVTFLTYGPPFKSSDTSKEQ